MIGCGAVGEIGGAAGEAQAENVRGEQEARECRRVAHGPSVGARERAGFGDDGDRFAAALNVGDSAQELAGVDGRIFSGERIAAGCEDDATTLGPFAHNAMNERAVAEEKENNFAAVGVGCGIRADREEIAGVDRGDHAAAVGDEANFAETMEDFGGERESGVAASVSGRVRRRGRGLLRHEFGHGFWRSSEGGGRRSCGRVARSQEFLRLKRH